MNKPFAYSIGDFNAVREKIRLLTGINLADSKDDMVYSRLSRRLRALKINSFEEYLTYLDANVEESEQFINALTTNLTSFFREAHHFEWLKDFVQQHPEPLSIWCAASSTGEEPYSIAMACAIARGSFEHNVRIVASDIDSKVLGQAKEGIYPLSLVEKRDLKFRKKFFLKGKGKYDGKAKIVPELRATVTFLQQNLLDSHYRVGSDIDIVFCRNVMIYFDKPTQEAILMRMLGFMKPNGYYIAGHSENFSHLSEWLRPLGKTIYQMI